MALSFWDQLAANQEADAAKYQTGFQNWLTGPVAEQPFVLGAEQIAPPTVGESGANLGLLSLNNAFGDPLSPEERARREEANSQIFSQYRDSLGFNNPVDWFTSVGDNRNALYGAYGAMAPNSSVQGMMGGIDPNPSTPTTDPNYRYPWESEISFGNRGAIPDLAGYAGQQLVYGDQFEGPIASKSSSEAQAILKQFYPNIPQSQLDQAAYAAMQKTGNVPYWGSGPIPTVQAIAKELGVSNSALDSWIAQNQDAFAKRYQTYRDQVHSSEDADSFSRTMGQIGGLASVLGPAIGGAMGFGPFGGSSSAASGGSNMGLWDSITGGLNDFGSYLSDLFGGSEALPELLGEAGGYGFTSAETLGQLPQLLGEAGGYGISGSEGNIFESLIKQATSNPFGEAAKTLQSITGSANSADWMRMLGGALSSGVGAYAANKQSNALEDMAERYEGYGAPYRQRLSNLYANPDSFLQSNEVQKPVQMGTDSLMRSLSMSGNPFGSGNALQQGQSYASDQLFSRLGQEKDRLAGFGGLANYNAAAPAATSNAINSNANAWNAAGAGANNIFSPPQTPAQQAAEWMKVMGR